MNRNITTAIGIAVVVLTGCVSVKQAVLPEGRQVPATFTAATDTTSNLPALKDFFADAQLQRLIDTALANNYDLKAALQQINSQGKYPDSRGCETSIGKCGRGSFSGPVRKVHNEWSRKL